VSIGLNASSTVSGWPFFRRQLDRHASLDELPATSRRKGGKSGPMPGLELIGNQHLDRLTDRFVRRVPKYRLGRRAPEHDPSRRGIADDHRIADGKEEDADPQVLRTERRRTFGCRCDLVRRHRVVLTPGRDHAWRG
jgi:hypothetical protein